jgi:hypothetical protein
MDEYICGEENLLNKVVINLIKYLKKFKRFCESIIDYNFNNNWDDNFKNNSMSEWFIYEFNIAMMNLEMYLDEIYWMISFYFEKCDLMCVVN